MSRQEFVGWLIAALLPLMMAGLYLMFTRVGNEDFKRWKERERRQHESFRDHHHVRDEVNARRIGRSCRCGGSKR
jgi:hypothetical protein